MNSRKILKEALRNRSSAAAATMWRLIAEGEASQTEAFEWVTHIAKQVVTGVFDAKFTASNRRAEAALKAIGFYGVRRSHETLEDLLDTLSQFNNLDTGRPFSRREQAELILAAGHFKGKNVTNLLKVIDRIKRREKLP